MNKVTQKPSQMSQQKDFFPPGIVIENDIKKRIIVFIIKSIYFDMFYEGGILLSTTSLFVVVLTHLFV